MTRALALALILSALAHPAAAQERPPERPAPEEPLEAPESEGGDMDGAQAEDAPEPATPGTDAAAQEPFGPPPPPVWFTLAESDAQFDACRLALSVMGARFRPVAPVTDPEMRDCGIARPLQLEAILPGIALTGAPVMRCDTALSLALWTRDFLQPATALLPDAPQLTGLQTGPAYSCRDRVGTGEAEPKPSEHGYGNAIDVMGFLFDQGDPAPILPRQGDGNTAESFQKAAQGTACLLFTTVLGPGSNAAHDDHLHLDIAARNGGWRLCE
ncbi:extensin family protein [Paracoccus hibiscisoli]|uniref:Extensin family protein n=1 Tax=Paracoccus hibiscisoli TaxID=2023261 RepID=A0A4U0R017_9RHOB|nr:extensin family protein [Paracoccus hibiscisoli]TJZ87927.1 extensin family protein [Paracoccus hibiscisoli]